MLAHHTRAMPCPILHRLCPGHASRTRGSGLYTGRRVLRLGLRSLRRLDRVFVLTGSGTCRRLAVYTTPSCPMRRGTIVSIRNIEEKCLQPHNFVLASTPPARTPYIPALNPCFVILSRAAVFLFRLFAEFSSAHTTGLATFRHDGGRKDRLPYRPKCALPSSRHARPPLLAARRVRGTRAHPPASQQR